MESANRTAEVYSGNAMHYSYGEGDAAGMFQSYYVPSMGHVCPSGSNGEVLKATDVLMGFFSKWSIGKRGKAAVTLPETSTEAHLFSAPRCSALAYMAAFVVAGFF
jgi:hypothetical protein